MPGYMDYGKCESCRFWQQWKYKPVFEKCTSPFAQTFSEMNSYTERADCTVTKEPLITGNRFGCIHWRNGEWDG